MKKILFLITACILSVSLLCTITAFFAQPPPPNTDFRGVWFYTALPTDTNKLKADLDTILAKGIALKGVQIAVPWWRVQENAPAQLPCDTCDHHSDLNSYKWADKLDAFLKIIAAETSTSAYLFTHPRMHRLEKRMWLLMFKREKNSKSNTS